MRPLYENLLLVTYLKLGLKTLSNFMESPHIKEQYARVLLSRKGIAILSKAFTSLHYLHEQGQVL